MVIYKATDTTNGKVYIGKTIGTMEERRRQHFYHLRYREGGAFHKALRERGEAFTWEVIDTEAKDKEDLRHRENYWIKFYKSFDPSFGYNYVMSVPEGKVPHKKTYEPKAVKKFHDVTKELRLRTTKNVGDCSPT